ncbi:hypothetical protein ACT7DJ_28580 [Bacillus cereus]
MGDVIDIYGLSPLQKGILFHTLYDQDDEHSFFLYCTSRLLARGAIGYCYF